MTAANEVKLYFDQPLASDAINIGHYHVEPGMGNPYSATLIASQHGILLRYRTMFPTNLDTLTVSLSGITGITGVPLETVIYPFTYIADLVPPALLEVQVLSKNKLKLVFSEMLQTGTASSLSHYQLVAPVNDKLNHFTNVEFADSVIFLTLAKKMQFTSQPYYVLVNDVQDLAGNMISNHHNKSHFVINEARDLSNLVVYPNPVAASEQDVVTFANFPLQQKGHIKIYSLAGDLVFQDTIQPINNVNPTYKWSLENKSHKKVSSGMYFYVIEMGGDLKKGKVAVLH
jgi:hypothetical protein